MFSESVNNENFCYKRQQFYLLAEQSIVKYSVKNIKFLAEIKEGELHNVKMIRTKSLG